MQLEIDELIDEQRMKEFFWTKEEFNWIPIKKKPFDWNFNYVLTKNKKDEIRINCQLEDETWSSDNGSIDFYSEFPKDKIEYKRGNIIAAYDSGEIDIIAHACNRTVGMGGGIARILKEKFKIDSDLERELRNDFDTPMVMIGDLCNIYCMLRPGGPSMGFAKTNTGVYDDSSWDRLDRLEKALTKLTIDNPKKKIGIPLVLSGLARDNSKKEFTDLIYFQKFVVEFIKHLPITVYYL
jgi:hypothetical protein